MMHEPASFRFTRPTRQLVSMLIACAIFAVGVSLIYAQLWNMFLTSPYLNGLILLVFVVGLLAAFWQVAQVSFAVKWIRDYNTRTKEPIRQAPRLLAPLYTLMQGDQLPRGMSTSSAQNILDSVSTRMDETRDFTHYLINLLIFLGLLGTFYGLSTTIPAVVETIRALNVADGEGANALSGFMSGLEKQLGGMGTAFSSSLIGLAGSLFVGLLELFAGHSQNRFYRELEDWLSGYTKIGMAESRGLDVHLEGAGDTALVKSLQSLSSALIKLDTRLADQTQNMQRIEALFGTLGENLADQTQMTQDVKIAIRETEHQLLRMSEDMTVGRDTTVSALRHDLMLVNQSLATLIQIQE